MYDEVAEWLRRWTANPLGSPRVSSNLILVGSLLIPWVPSDATIFYFLKYFDPIAYWISDPVPELLLLYTCNQLVSRHLKMTSIYF